MEQKRLVIAVDCDDVLISTSRYIIEDYNERLGTKLTLHDMYQPVRMETWGTDSEDVAIERVNEFLRSDRHAAIAPNKQAIHAVKQLANVHELHLVTGRPDFLEPVTRAMLTKYFSGCFQSVEHTNFYAPSTSNVVKRTKGEVCKRLGADILIDDHIAHGESVIEAGLKKVIVFGDYPWNQHEALPTGMVRCVDWNTTVREVENIAKQ